MDLKEQVEEVLKNNEETRNSDIALTIEVWKLFHSKYIKKGQGGDLGIYLEDLYKLPSQDGIKRYRADFNAHRMYLPTDPAVFQKRRLNERAWKEDLGYDQKDV